MSHYTQVINIIYHRPIPQVLKNKKLFALFDLPVENKIHIISKFKAPTQELSETVIGASSVKNMANF